MPKTADTTKNQPGGPDDSLFTLEEARAFLRVGRSTLFALLRSGALAYTRQRSRRYVWRSDCIALLNQNRVASEIG